MDPNAALEELRRLAKLASKTGGAVYAAELAEKFQDLDTWLTSGGFIPDAWWQGRET